jgi:uncharacterized protein YodC (DUF2158 family)
MTFVVGNVARLKSGGDDMTVELIDPRIPDEVHCVWFVDVSDGTELRHGIFNLADLVKLRD